ncbi:PREDICTED: protein lifeguard 1-like [Cyprinodon variegatus]|uniref:protein lifeguard 1-like n=1 Tax=Cyprinodon variegatus TaxID=28743 RepID=UPI0007425C7A|nr:PREDICTED: protein lifeguard 1-like [Cyprinodon variegatus]
MFSEMDQTNGNTAGRFERHPHPYSPPNYERNPYTGMTYEVGNGNIAIVSRPASYGNMVPPQEPPPYGGNQYYSQDPPVYSQESEENPFSVAGIRRGFILKVYLTLMIQLLCTVGIICTFIYCNTLKTWIYNNYWFSYTMMSVVLVLIVVLACCDNIRRRVPLNFIALGTFTVAEGLMLGSVAAYFNAEAVMWAVGATAFVTFGISLFAMQSKWDFTPKAGCMWMFACSLLSFLMMCAIIRSQYLYIFYAYLGTVLFSFYLLLDTQLILGGKHRKYEISPEEYIYAALSLYLDIVNLFLLLLQIINCCN